MFDFLKPKKASVKHTVTLKHRNGEQVSITIEGTNINHINYVEKRIKETFNLGPAMPSEEDLDKIWDDAEKIFKEFGDMFKR